MMDLVKIRYDERWIDVLVGTKFYTAIPSTTPMTLKFCIKVFNSFYFPDHMIDWFIFCIIDIGLHFIQQYLYLCL